MSKYSDTNLYKSIVPYEVPQIDDGLSLGIPAKDIDGGYTGGMIVVKNAWVQGYQSVHSSEVSFLFSSTGRVCVFAIPIKTECPYDRNIPQYEEWNYGISERNDTFIYFILTKDNNRSVTVLDCKESRNDYPELLKEEHTTVLNEVKEGRVNTASFSFSSELNFWYNRYVNDSSYRVAPITREIYNIMQLEMGKSENSVLAGLRLWYVVGSSNDDSLGYTTISHILNTNVPIFTPSSMGEMAKYFRKEEYKPSNPDELVESTINLKTDWTIYVNGAQNPNISTTWKSDALETFLNSDNNKIGLKKESVAVEFRYPLYKHTGLGLGLSESEYGQDSLVYDGGYNYNSKKNDSYESLMFQNYPYLKERFEVDSFIYGENSEPRIETEKEFYSQLQFRLKINEQKFSSWCYFNIGVIGSPNIADFSLMNNKCGVLPGVIGDGSTVTIIYDESPTGQGGDKGYIDPTPDTPDIDPSEPTPIVNPTESGLNLLTTSYVMTEQQIKQLANFLWGATFLQNLKLVNNSPIENIVGCKIMPIAISGNNSVVQIGNVDTNVNGAVVSSVPVVTIGSLSIGKLYDNFLDYAPYTQITLFLPFIGFTEIDTNVVVDNTLSIKYVFDIVTGTCKAMLYVNDIYYTSYNGSCGIDVPLVASNRAQVESQFLSSVINGAISGNVGGIVDAGIGAQYHSQSSGSYSPTCGWQETKQAYAIINRPTCQYPETYGHNIGYPCKLSRSLNTLRGFTVCDSNVDLSGISCTEMERQEIYNALTSGVYL